MYDNGMIDEGIEIGVIPVWLLNRLRSISTNDDYKNSFYESDRDTDVNDLCDQSLLLGLSIFNINAPKVIDHYGRYTTGSGEEVLILRPSGLCLESIKALVEFCTKYGCYMTISGNTDYSKEACWVKISDNKQGDDNE